MSAICHDCVVWQRRQLVPSSLLWTSEWHERQSDDFFLNFNPSWQLRQRRSECCPVRVKPVDACANDASLRIFHDSGVWQSLHSNRMFPCGDSCAEALPDRATTHSSTSTAVKMPRQKSEQRIMTSDRIILFPRALSPIIWAIMCTLPVISAIADAPLGMA